MADVTDHDAPQDDPGTTARVHSEEPAEGPDSSAGEREQPEPREHPQDPAEG